MTPPLKKIKIGIDIRKMHSYHKSRGIGLYTKQLIEALKKYTNEEIFIIEENDSQIKLDVIHFPFFDLFFHTLPIFKKFPTVVTIHDVIPLVFPNHYPPGIRGNINNFLQKIALKSSSAIITDSESSKKDMINHLGVQRDKVHKVYLAPSDNFRQIKDKIILANLKRKYELPDKFILYVGDVNWNKNLINMADACVMAKADLVLVGRGFNQKEDLLHHELESYHQFINRYSSNNLIHIKGYICDEDLVFIYNLASILLLPSFYEGFGLPILEAQACGTPVITCNVSSMPEVAGNGALFVDPYQVSEIEKAIRSIWDDASLRLNLIKKGFENVSQFSWKKTAQETVKVYYNVLR